MIAVEEVEARVTEIASLHFNRDESEITRETDYKDDLHADSLDMVELAMEMEDLFDISVPDDAIDRIRTVGQAADFIREQLEAM